MRRDRSRGAGRRSLVQTMPGPVRGKGRAAVLGALLLAASAPHAEEAQTLEDWGLRCPTPATCLLEQRVFIEGQEDAPLIQMVFQAAEPPGQVVAAIRVPLGVRLDGGLSLRIDGGDARRIDFHHCRSEGCIALFPLDPALRRSLERGREAQVAFRLVDGRRLGVPLSLLGVTAGLEALQAAASSSADAAGARSATD